MPTWPPSYASNRPPGHVAFVDRLLDLPRLGRVADELELERGRPPPELAKKAGFRPAAPLADDASNDFRIRVEPHDIHDPELHPARRVLGWIVAVLLLVLLITPKVAAEFASLAGLEKLG